MLLLHTMTISIFPLASSTHTGTPVPPPKTTNLVHGGDLGREVVGGHPQLLHDYVPRRREAEPVDADDLGRVLVPGSGDAGLHGDALGARGREDGLLVVVRLALVHLHARHGHDPM